MKLQVKKDKKDIEILPPPDEHQKVDLGTRWPSSIGRKDKPNDDGKIRDAFGNVLG
jgi:hypothetical protein